MTNGRFTLIAELGKLSQGKPTTIDPSLIAKLAIDKIRAGQKDSDVRALEQLYHLEAND